MKRKGEITGDMLLGDVVSKFPETVTVMVKYGLHCAGCHVSAFESVEQGAKAHGLEDKEIEKMLKEMNTVLEKARKK